MRSVAMAALASGLVLAVGMVIRVVTEPDPRLPVWLMVGAPLLLILAASYTWWAAGFIERPLQRRTNNGPTADGSG
jgi:beta-lactamase regulating signal transducer with metallopeptidase domain